jgi:hypothetical protein
MIEEFKRDDGRGLGFEKLGEKVGKNSGESVYEKCVESNPEFEVWRHPSPTSKSSQELFHTKAQPPLQQARHNPRSTQISAQNK